RLIRKQESRSQDANDGLLPKFAVFVRHSSRNVLKSEREKVDVAYTHHQCIHAICEIIPSYAFYQVSHFFKLALDWYRFFVAGIFIGKERSIIHFYRAPYHAQDKKDDTACYCRGEPPSFQRQWR